MLQPNILALLLLLAVFSSAQAAEPVSLMATQESTKRNLRLLVGPEDEIKLCDMARDAVLKKGLAKRERIYIFALRHEVDPIVAERLENMGHPILFLNSPRPEQVLSSPHMELRSLYATLARVLPDRAAEFQIRLLEAEAMLRVRGRNQAIAAPANYATTSESESASATNS
ncbi:MAG: hypothetical protein ACE361_05845 [Aureliella sp.]